VAVVVLVMFAGGCGGSRVTAELRGELVETCQMIKLRSGNQTGYNNCTRMASDVQRAVNDDGAGFQCAWDEGIRFTVFGTEWSRGSLIYCSGPAGR